MANNNQQVVNGGGGAGFLSLLAVLFIGLKLTGYIAWSWWWALAPLWMPIAILLGIILFGAISVGLVAGFSAVVKSRRAKARANKYK